MKPDLVAPGNKLVFAEAHNNLLVTSNPSLDAISLGTAPAMKMMRMSGTSVATPIAAGAAALMLQLNPKLTPNMVKAFMEYTAQKLNGFGVLEQGAGQLNIEGAMRLAHRMRPDLSSPVQIGEPLLTVQLQLLVFRRQQLHLERDHRSQIQHDVGNRPDHSLSRDRIAPANCSATASCLLTD